ncbi:hypothetical protein B0T16DRAFT_457474 [Cercophora newfieldiana]|uniref:G domain-containing protein n=1 Tax=Cercophora newfieldiana TaxID=92897 RepID=A0AA40CNF3_9PEZI|nr:hypothetical protein B0T16DRAFT_457474 [Cercophora newfieldiana]
MSAPFVVLLLGSVKSGKTTFVKSLLKAGVVDGPTTTCREYEVNLSGSAFMIIDTPGFDNSVRANLVVLRTIAEKLDETTKRKTNLKVNGVIYFHRITDLRLTGPAATQIEILEQICGKDFYPHVAFVTSMWNRINRKVDVSYDNLHKALGQKYSAWEFFQFTDGASAEKVLESLRGNAATTATLQLEKEVRASGSKASSVRKTKAGKRIEREMDRNRCTIL